MSTSNDQEECYRDCTLSYPLVSPSVDGDDHADNHPNAPVFVFSHTKPKTECTGPLQYVLGCCTAIVCCPPCFFLCQLSRIPFISFTLKDVWLPLAFYMLDMAILVLYTAYRINSLSEQQFATDTFTLVSKPVVTYAFVHLMTGICGVVVDYQAASRSTYYFTLPHNHLFLPYLEPHEKSVMKIALTWGVRSTYQIAFNFSLLLCSIEVMYTQIYKDRHDPTASVVNSYLSSDLFMGEMSLLFCLFLIVHRVRVKHQEKEFLNLAYRAKTIKLLYTQINGESEFDPNHTLTSLLKSDIVNWFHAGCCTREAYRLLPIMALLAVVFKAITPFSVAAALSSTSLSS